MRRRAARLAFALAILAVFLLAGLALRMWGFGLVRVTGTSMNRTLADGDVVLVTRFDYRAGRSPAFGQIVECTFPNRRGTYLKRVVGLPGDEVEFVSGALCRNGVGLAEPYVSSPTEDFEIRLGEDEYLLLGDNRSESYDSRMADMGPVGGSAFIGRARLVVWPPEHIGILY